MASLPKEIVYSQKYADDDYEYRHVMLNREALVASARVREEKLRVMEEHEWRSIGVRAGPGWEHYEIYTPEPHVLLFRRPLAVDPATGNAQSKVLTLVTEGRASKDIQVSALSCSGEEVKSLLLPDDTRMDTLHFHLATELDLRAEQLRLLTPGGTLLRSLQPGLTLQAVQNRQSCPPCQKVVTRI